MAEGPGVSGVRGLGGRDWRGGGGGSDSGGGNLHLSVKNQKT